MSDIVKILKDMAEGRKNEAGDYWSKDYCNEAAEYILLLEAQLKKAKNDK